MNRRRLKVPLSRRLLESKHWVDGAVVNGNGDVIVVMVWTIRAERVVVRRRLFNVSSSLDAKTPTICIVGSASVSGVRVEIPRGKGVAKQ